MTASGIATPRLERRRNTRCICGLLALAAFGNAVAAESGDWKGRLGVGVGVGAKYLGGDNYEVSPLPLLSVSWRDRVQLSPFGLRVRAIGNDAARLGVVVAYNDGRDSDDADALDGLDDVDETVEAGLVGALKQGPWELTVRAVQDVGSGHEGYRVTGGLGYGMRLGPRVAAGINTRLTYADADYNNAFFGVSAREAARLPYDAYEADGGLTTASLGANLIWPVVGTWFAALRVQATRLLGDAADSPIVQDTTQYGGAVLLGYRF